MAILTQHKGKEQKKMDQYLEFGDNMKDILNNLNNNITELLNKQTILIKDKNELEFNKNNFFWVEADNYKGFNMTVYNRWGEKLFSSNQRLPGWNGWYKGKPTQEDVYIYEVNIQDIYDKWYHFSGTVTLLN